MELTLALLADYANISREGKLNIMGIFEQIHAHNFPAVHAQMQLVIRCEATAFDAGTHPVRVTFIDEDARELFAISGAVTIPESRAGENLTTNQIFVLNGVILPHPGTYEFVITVADEEIGRTPLRVVSLPRPSSQPSSPGGVYGS
ncbi:MAG: hypothetical protein HY259_01120 [Chloroflexi bacterium]|nr:hypothetical protein [Chloroflexota bacterium]